MSSPQNSTAERATSLTILGTQIEYSDRDVINLDEGLIGLSHLKQMVLIGHEASDPFLWLASLDDSSIAFLVLNPLLILPDYTLELPDSVYERLGVEPGSNILSLGIVIIAAEWKESTINLRAPVIVSPESMRGVQIVLENQEYRVDQPLAFAA